MHEFYKRYVGKYQKFKYHYKMALKTHIKSRSGTALDDKISKHMGHGNCKQMILKMILDLILEPVIF